jgi:proline racemase
LVAGPLKREDGIIRSVNAVVVSPGHLDRSPCGTGTSARLAALHAHSHIRPGELSRHESVIGSQFDSRVEVTTTIGSYDAFVRGFVVGRPCALER